MTNLQNYYRIFRRFGLNAVQAYTAAYCAVRVKTPPTPRERQDWAHLFRGKPASTLALTRGSMAAAAPVR